MTVIELRDWLSTLPDDTLVMLGSSRQTFADTDVGVYAGRTFAEPPWARCTSRMVIHPDDEIDIAQGARTIGCVVIGAVDR